MRLLKLNQFYKLMQRTIASTAGRVEETIVCHDKTIKLTQDMINSRNEIFDTLLKKQNEFLASQPKQPIKITLPDGKQIDGVCLETTPLSIAMSISKKLAERSMVARVCYSNKHSHYFDKVIECEAEAHDHQEEDSYELIGLSTPLQGDCKLEILDFSTDQGKQTFWHSSAHILGGAMEQVYGAFLTHGPPHGQGYYYDSFIGQQKVYRKDYEMIEGSMKKFIEKKTKFEQLILSKEEALQLFASNPFKVKLIMAKIKDGERTSAYRSGNLIDLCTGPHIDNSSKIQAFQISKDSSSYWLGKQKLDTLQRIYGLSFPSKKELKAYLAEQQELAKRDHKNVGPQQKLFHFHPYAPGCPFFLPHGTRIFNRLVELMKHEYFYRGFTEVITPTMFKNELWKTSGHYFKYAEDMFFSNNKEEKFGIKPMNCPSHCLMFKSSLKSYRDLPVRYADFGVLHRNEVSGALTGLTRVRKFHQDDAHIFCTVEQLQQEVKGQIDFVAYVYKQLGFDFSFELSTRPENYLGEIEIWNNAEKALTEVLDQTGIQWKLNPGDGAFYGPKIDYKVKDCFGRLHQLGTIQLDFQLPQRFNLQYNKKQEQKEGEEKEKKEKVQEQDNEEEVEEIVNDNEEENLELEAKKYAQIKPLRQGCDRPVIIHRAILGSLERCMAILIEHYGGKWPFWLSPRQISIVPVSQKFDEYAQYLQKRLQLSKYYADLNTSNFTLNKRIRTSQLEGYNYILVVGEKEVQNHTVNVRKRDQKQPVGEMTVDQFFELLLTEDIPASNLLKNQQLEQLCYPIDKLTNEEKQNLYKYDQELQEKNFLEGEGLQKGKKDEELWEKLKEVKLDNTQIPNLQRWYKMMSKLSDFFAVSSTEGKVIVFLQNKNSKMMDEILEIKEHQSCVWKVRWGDFRIGNLLATCSVDNTIRIWKIYKCQKELRYQYEMLYKYEGEYSINSIDWSPISLGTKLAGCDSEGNLIIIYKMGSQWDFLKYEDEGIKEPLNAVVWAPNFEINPKEENQCLLFTGGCDGFIYIHKFEQNEKIQLSFQHRIQAHKDWIRDISFCPNVHLKYYTFATASEDKKCIVWKLFDTKEFLTEKQELNFDSPVWRVSWNFTGHLLSVGYTSSERKNMVNIYSENQDGIWEQVKSLNN